ncbi:hypothetical protein ACFWTE_07645 [Nocardiopsis sp. NPDC058631]|uniref:hypothetical protein n=1 Tax=Nocardiopsis sp. NPDC058631 TaxID=3346566 RepID=UPI003667BEE4
MPRPSKYMSRSDLGWGSSPADKANPRSGLVIHYDSADQGLADKKHSSCVSYWRNTRSFHTGPSRGWADIGYCVDEATEILTEDGWRSFHRIAPGDVVLTLDHTTGLSEWQPLQDVLVFPAAPRELIRMQGCGHSSLTTPGHRWPVERVSGRSGTGGEKNPDARERRWATTDTLTRGDRIPLSAPCAHLPTERKWSDHLVERVAWFWTAGHAAPRSADPADDTGPAGPRPAGSPLSSDAERVLLEHAPGRVPTHAFLRALPQEQLDLFIGASLQGDGRGDRANASRVLDRKDRASAEAFQFAATLAGYATSLRRRTPTPSVPSPPWQVELHGEDRVAPGDAAAGGAAVTITREAHDGPVWCVRTPNSTWLARREGTVYFTGNSFMACAHGHVLEGRGLYRAQAAQPGGNTSHYSVTLATGPKDPITPEQINAVRQLRQWLMEPDTSISGAVLGHRDFISTSCPGEKAYALVKNGTFAKKPDESEGEDDVPRHRRFEKDRAQELEPGTWASLRFDRRHDGHTGDLYALVGPEEPDGALYDFSVGVTVEGLGAGTEMQLRATEYEPDGEGGWKVARNRPIESPLQAAGNGHFTYAWKGNLSKGRRVRVRVAQFGDTIAQLTSATAEVFYWPK